MPFGLASALKSRRPIDALNRAYVLEGAAEAAFLPFVPLYLFDSGMGVSTIGVVLAAAALASFVAAPGWAYLADHGLRPERAVVVAAGAAAVMVLLLALSRNPITLAFATVALWAVRAPFASLLDSIALHLLGRANTSGYARIRLRMSAGWAVAVFAAGAVLQVVGVRWIPFLYAPLIALFGLTAWRGLAPAGEKAEAEPASTAARAQWLPGASLAMVGFLVSGFLLGVSFTAAGNFVTLQINFLGGGLLLIGLAAGFQALAEIPTMAYMHLLTSRLSHRALYVAGCAVLLLVFLTWAFVSSAVVVAVLKLVTGVGFALVYVAAVLIMDDIVPLRLRSTGQALVKAVTFGLAPVAGMFGGGFVYSALGARTMFLAAAVLVGGAGLVAMMAVPHRAPPGKSLEPVAAAVADIASHP